MRRIWRAMCSPLHGGSWLRQRCSHFVLLYAHSWQSLVRCKVLVDATVCWKTVATTEIAFPFFQLCKGMYVVKQNLITNTFPWRYASCRFYAYGRKIMAIKVIAFNFLREFHVVLNKVWCRTSLCCTSSTPLSLQQAPSITLAVSMIRVATAGDDKFRTRHHLSLVFTTLVKWKQYSEVVFFRL